MIFKDLAWNVTEEEYRQDSSLSYSGLSEFYRSGPKSLISKEKKDTDSLRFGSLVDCLITEPETLNDRFYIARNDKIPSDSIRKIVENINFEFNVEGFDKIPLNEIPMESVIVLADAVGYQSNWKDQTRYDKIIKEGSEYFNILKESIGKIKVSQYDYTDALECVDALKTNSFTKEYFNEDPFDYLVEHYYQLKFKSFYGDVPIRGMLDKIIVDNEAKTIQPIDLKTTGKNEWDFEKSFVEWNYWIQSPQYTYLIESIIADTEYSDYKILPFKFIVVNRRNKMPMCWTIPSAASVNNWSMDKFGVNWMTLAQNAHWHIKNDYFDYPVKVVKQNGDCIIDLNHL